MKNLLQKKKAHGIVIIILSVAKVLSVCSQKNGQYDVFLDFIFPFSPLPDSSCVCLFSGFFSVFFSFEILVFWPFCIFVYLVVWPFYIFLLWDCGCLAIRDFSKCSVQLLSHVTPWTAACQASVSINNSWSLLKFMSIESVMPSNNLILCNPFLLLPSVFPRIRVFSSESVLCIRLPKCWSFSFSISPSNECSGLISFRTDWFDLLAVQGTLKCLLQHHSSKASVLWCPAFFIVHLSHPYMTTGKTKALTRRTFVGKVMFLLFNILSRYSHHLQWFWSPPK